MVKKSKKATAKSEKATASPATKVRNRTTGQICLSLRDDVQEYVTWLREQMGEPTSSYVNAHYKRRSAEDEVYQAHRQGITVDQYRQLQQRKMARLEAELDRECK